MKRLLLLIALLTASALAQSGNTTTIPFAGVPAGSCGPTMFAINTANADFYDCLAGAWNKVNSAGGAGTVTSVGLTVNSTSPSGIYTVTGSPVIAAGTLNVNLAGTSGGIPYFSDATTLSTSAALTSNAVVLGGGAGATPKTVTAFTTNGTTTMTVGVAGGGNGVLALAGNTSGTATLTAPATAGTTTNAVVSSNVLNLPAGAAATPSLEIGATNTGWYNNAASLVATVAGTDGLLLTSTVVRAGASATIGFPASGAPTSGATDTGINRLGANILAVGPGNHTGLIQSGMSVFVTTNFTTSGVGTALENITGLAWTFPATAANWPFHCHIGYSQAVGTAAVAFGIKATTNNPTNIFATGEMFTAAGTVTTGVLATLATTTATNIVTGTPGGTGTNLPVDIYGELELPASAVTINIMTSTATAADTVTVLRGSYCSLAP